MNDGEGTFGRGSETAEGGGGLNDDCSVCLRVCEDIDEDLDCTEFDIC